MPDNIAEIPARPPVRPLENLHNQHLAIQQYQRYFFQVPDNSLVQDFVDPGYWVNCRAMLRKNDVIELVSHNGLFELHLRCDSVSGGLPVMRPIYSYSREDNLTSGDSISFSPGQGWSAHAGGEALAESLPDKAAAEAVLAEFRGGGA